MRHEMLTQHTFFVLHVMAKRYAESAFCDACRTSSGLSLCRSHSGPVVLKWEWVYEGGCASWWAVGPGGSGVRAAIKLPGLRINSTLLKVDSNPTLN